MTAYSKCGICLLIAPVTVHCFSITLTIALYVKAQNISLFKYVKLYSLSPRFLLVIADCLAIWSLKSSLSSNITPISFSVLTCSMMTLS